MARAGQRTLRFRTWTRSTRPRASSSPSPRGTPFSDASLADRAARDWKAASLDGIGLHEARHTYPSVMIAAGVDLKTISEWMGHASITLTLDRYGHLLPGSAKVALGLLDEFLEQELAA